MPPSPEDAPNIYLDDTLRSQMKRSFGRNSTAGQSDVNSRATGQADIVPKRRGQMKRGSRSLPNDRNHDWVPNVFQTARDSVVELTPAYGIAKELITRTPPLSTVTPKFNAALTYGVGVGAALSATALSGGTATLASPVIGISAGTAVGQLYDNREVDNWFDDKAKNTGNYVRQGGRYVDGLFSYKSKNRRPVQRIVDQYYQSRPNP